MPIASSFANLSAFQPFDQTAFYPLRNTAVDPTSETWRINNPGYVFIPNSGINTVGPMTNAGSIFMNNRTFNDPDISIWDVSTFVDMSNMFYGCTTFNRYLGDWQTGSATNMSGMFRQSAFNQNINLWNVSKVTNFSLMFYSTSFNQSLVGWDTSSATDMSFMFAYSNFNQNINSWNVSNVDTLLGMFERSPFNQALNTWNTRSVTDFGAIFKFATSFNQDISGWNVSRGRFFDSMFENATSFNCGQSSGIAHDLMQRLGSTGWQTQIALNMVSMFQNASSFNGNISGWCMQGIPYLPNNFATGANVNFTVARQPPWGYCPTFYPMRQSPVDVTSQTWRNNNPGYQFRANVGIITRTPMTNASYMFYNAIYDDEATSEWDASTFTNTQYMFSNCNFNQSLANWNVSNVKNMSGMFGGSLFSRVVFNQPIGNWNVGNVTDMSLMFYNNSRFNQDISAWNVSRVTNMDRMFFSATAFNCGLGYDVPHELMQRTATGGWRTNSVINFDAMFQEARAFSGDLSSWCTTSSAGGSTNPPLAFASYSGMSLSDLPIWGRCPIP